MHTVETVSRELPAVPMTKLIALPASLPAALPLLAGAAGAVVALAPTPAAACQVAAQPNSERDITVDNATRTVRVIYGRWADVRECINGNQAWWDDNQVARKYSESYITATGTQWLGVNQDPADLAGPKNVSPLVAWDEGPQGGSQPSQPVSIKVQTVAVRTSSNGGSADSNSSSNSNSNSTSNPGSNQFVLDLGDSDAANASYYWLAFAGRGVDPDPAPAPLPLIGGAAALLWSRRLRRRVARGRRASG